MPKFTGLFEDSMIILPRDENTAQDLRAVENIDGVPMVASLEKKTSKTPNWCVTAIRRLPVVWRTMPP
jgi:phage FluMu gp28-like protein